MPPQALLQIRPANGDDLDAMWRIFQEVIAAGDALPFAEDFDVGTFRSHWFGPHRSCVAISGDRVVGMSKTGANYPGRGSHVASATYLVDPGAQGRGIGRALVERSLAQARDEGYLSMQFNDVVSTNAPPSSCTGSWGSRSSAPCPRRSATRRWAWWMPM